MAQDHASYVPYAYKERNVTLPRHGTGLEELMNKLILSSVALASTMLASAAFAEANGPCLQTKQIFASSAIDDQTVIVNDHANRTYAVRLRGFCNGLMTTPWRVSFFTPTNSACLGPNDRIAFRHPTVGRNTCYVESVSTDLGSVASINRPLSRVN
jgi:hypothetical protein